MKKFGITKKEMSELRVGDRVEQNCFLSFTKRPLTILEVTHRSDIMVGLVFKNVYLADRHYWYFTNEQIRIVKKRKDVYGITQEEFKSLAVGDKIKQNSYGFDGEILTISKVDNVSFSDALTLLTFEESTGGRNWSFLKNEIMIVEKAQHTQGSI